MTDTDEFFAELTTIYFGAASRGYGTSVKARLMLEADFP